MTRAATWNPVTGAVKVPLTEAAFMRQVTDIAVICGFAWAHFRPAMTTKGWRTAVSGPLGKGFPDLVLVNARTGRLLFVELKAQGKPLRPEQHGVLELLRFTKAEVYAWHPSDYDAIVGILRGDA